MSNIPTISYPAPNTARREPYAQRRASRERQLGRGHRHDQQQTDAPLGYTQNPYLSHLRPRPTGTDGGYAESEISSSSFGGTSILSGSLIGSDTTTGSNLGGNGRYRGNAPTPSISRTGASPSHSTSPAILAPIPQRIPSSSPFPFNPQTHSPSPYLHPPSSSSLLNPSGTTTNPSSDPTSSASVTRTKKPRRRRIDETIDTPLRRLIRYASVDLRCPAWVIVVIGLTVIALGKWIVGMRGDGSSHPLRSGNMDLHRTWMTTTTSEALGIRWYTSTLNNPGQLDRPPLKAYLSWLFGKIGRSLIPSSFSSSGTRAGSVSVSTSRGMGRYMRGTVLALETVSWWPIVAVWVWKGWGVGGRSKRTRIVTILSILLQPTLILIDNASFDHTSFSLAMTLLAVYLFQRGNDLGGIVVFTAGLLFDQTGFWWAAAVGGYVVGKCLWLGGDQGRTLAMKLGGTIGTTLFVAFLPFLRPFSSAPLVIFGRLFSSKHGMVGNKVASFWGASHVLFGWERWFGLGFMNLLAGLATLLGIAPTAGILLWVSYRLRLPPNTPPSTSPRSTSRLPPTAPLLPLALFTSSMACYLFSPHTQGKNIVFPMLSVLMLLGEKGEGDGTVWDGIAGLLNVATFSLYPLMKQDGLVAQYLVWTIGWNYLVGYNPLKVVDLKMRWFGYVVYSCIVLDHVMEALFPASHRNPNTYDDINILISFTVFSLAWLVASWKSLEMAVGMVGLGEIGSDRPVSRGNKKDK